MKRVLPNHVYFSACFLESGVALWTGMFAMSGNVHLQGGAQTERFDDATTGADERMPHAGLRTEPGRRLEMP